MTQQIELSPELRTQAEGLADIAEKDPAQLRQAIADKTLEQLDALSAILEERRVQPSEEAVAALREQMNALLASKTFDQRLVELQRAVRLARLVGERAQRPAPTVGRTMKRTVLQMLSFFESAPSGVTGLLGNIVPGIGLAGTLSTLMPSFARRNLLSMDIEDAIAAEQRLGEVIRFDALSNEQFQHFDTASKEAITKKEPLPSVAVLVKKYLAAARERNLRQGTPQAPITVTVADLLSGKAETEVSELRTESREQKVQAAMNLPAVTAVEFSDIARYEGGTMQLPENELQGLSPRAKTRAAVLVQAVAAMPNAEVLTVVPSGPTKIDWIDGKRTALLSLANLPKDLVVLSDLLGRGKPEKITTVSIGTNDRIGQKTIVFGYEGDQGVLSVPNRPDMLAALAEKIGGLQVGIDDGGAERWTLENGEFTPLSAPVPVQ